MISHSTATSKRRWQIFSVLVVLAFVCLLCFVLIVVQIVRTPIIGTWCDAASVSESVNPSQTAVAVVALYETQDTQNYRLFIRHLGIFGTIKKVDSFEFDQFNPGTFENRLQWSRDGNLLVSPVQYSKKGDPKCEFTLGYDLNTARLLSGSQVTLIQQHGGLVSSTWTSWREMRWKEVHNYLAD